MLAKISCPPLYLKNAPYSFDKLDEIVRRFIVPLMKYVIIYEDITFQQGFNCQLDVCVIFPFESV